MSGLDHAIVLGYVIGILVLGFAISRRIRSFADFFVAGGRMTTPLLVCTLVSTYYGLDVLFGASEVGFVDGVVGWFFYSRPYYIAIIVTALLFARKLKRTSFLSLPEIAGATYGRATQAVVAAASFVYALPLLAVMGIGVLLDLVFGIPFGWGVVLGAAVSLVYTLFGGLLADALTDTVQFTLMCVTLGIAALLALEPVGGMEGLRQALPASYFDPRGTYPLGVLVVFSVGALSVLVEPAIYQRIFAARDYRSVLVALGIGIALWAAFDWIVTVLGMAAAASGMDVEPRYALLRLTLETLPVGLTGLFVAGVIATAMSTIDSYLLIAGGNISYDMVRPWKAGEMNDATLLRLTRWMVGAAAIASVLFALFFTSMVSAWVFMASILVATALVPVTTALYLPLRPRPVAGLASAMVGLTVAAAVFTLTNALGTFDEEWGTMIWSVQAFGRDWQLWQEYAVLFALPASALAFVAGHVLGQPKSEESP